MPIQRPLPRRIHYPSIRRIAGQMMRQQQREVMDQLYPKQPVARPPRVNLNKGIPKR